MTVYIVLINPACFIKSENFNPILGVFEDKEEAEELAEKKKGYYVVKREVNYNEF